VGWQGSLGVPGPVATAVSIVLLQVTPRPVRQRRDTQKKYRLWDRRTPDRNVRGQARSKGQKVAGSPPVCGSESAHPGGGQGAGCRGFLDRITEFGWILSLVERVAGCGLRSAKRPADK